MGSYLSARRALIIILFQAGHRSEFICIILFWVLLFDAEYPDLERIGYFFDYFEGVVRLKDQLEAEERDDGIGVNCLRERVQAEEVHQVNEEDPNQLQQHQATLEGRVLALCYVRDLHTDGQVRHQQALQQDQVKKRTVLSRSGWVGHNRLLAHHSQ